MPDNVISHIQNMPKTVPRPAPEDLVSKLARESVELVKLPFDELVDKKTTMLFWTLKESVGRQDRKIYLTDRAIDTIFENVDRYRICVMEAAGVPGSTRPAEYRPDMPGGSGKKIKPGIIGKGLNWLDKKAKAVGGALSNFGHQFTTNVTKEKLKMNWQQKGKPSDSDALAAWMVTQGVPQQIVTDIYTSMGIPYTAPADKPADSLTAEPEVTTPTPAPTPKTEPTVTPTVTPTTPTVATTTPTVTPTTPTPAAKTSQTMQPQGFNASNIGNLKPTPGSIVPKPAAKAATPDYSKSITGYGKQSMTVNPMKTKQKEPAVAESLTWSRGFNPGGMVFEKMAKSRELSSKLSEMSGGMGAASVGTAMSGNGFVNGGPGTISRPKLKKAKK
jgi:hypothetical protein